MADANWQKVREIFDAAVQYEPVARQNYINEACRNDKKLLLEVESLFSSLANSDGFLESPAFTHVADLIAAETKTLERGRRFGHYEIIREIGDGGMGQVYLAQDLQLDRRVAVKILNEELSRDETNLRRFVREAKAASALNHPNILVIHEIGETDGIHYLVTEFIEGKTLREVLPQSQMSVMEVLDLAIQIAGSLAAAHGAHLVHRDIKPENVMVRPDGYVKVLDFGLAKLIEQKNRSSSGFEESTVKLGQTAKSVILGTVHYMSPEQAKGEELDERTDIFSLGAVIYEMLAGKAPFAADSMSESLANLINAEPQPLSLFASETPEELQRIVSKTLSKNKDQRYRTMMALLADLKEVRENLTLEGKLEARHSSNNGHSSMTRTNAQVSRRTASAEYLLNNIRQHARGGLILTAAVFAVVAVAYFVYWHYYAQGDKASIVDSSRATSIRSIAVLPLTNESNNPDTQYLSDGVSESLINSLSQLPGVSVIARNSSFKYRGKDAEPEQVANALHVEGVLIGRVAQRGDNLLINVELVDARNKTQVWGEQFNRKGTDLLQVQSEISREIADRLRLRLTAGEQQQLINLNNVNPQAYELLLRGRFSESKGGTENRKKAIQFFKEAIAVDPSYALAYAQLSSSYSGLVNNNLGDPQELRPKAEAFARKALELDEKLAEGHLATASVKLAAWDWATAQRELKRAIELNPNLVAAHTAYAYYLYIQGRHDESAAEGRRAKELDPLAPGIKGMMIFDLLSAGKNDQAIQEAKKMVELDQNNPSVHMALGETYWNVGNYREAIAAYHKGIKLGDTSPDAQIYLAMAYADNGDHEKARSILRQLETGKEYVSPLGLASIYAALGERDQAFALLERAYAQHDQQLIWLGGPELKRLRSDARFQDLVRRVGVASP